MKIKYSPDASDKLRSLKQTAGGKSVGNIMRAINGLITNPKKCPSIERMLEIPSPYYFLHIENNYVFYRIDDETIFVTDIYHERENFMWKMFGIKLRTQESIDYWGE